MGKPEFTVLNGEYTIHRFSSTNPVPPEVYNSSNYWIGKTEDELSVVCESPIELNSDKSEPGWKVIKLIGPFELDTVGILSGVSQILAAEKISIFALSTYDTDYILIKDINLVRAVETLTDNKFQITSTNSKCLVLK